VGERAREDKLQEDVKGLFELLRSAGVKIWMLLTGDKPDVCCAYQTGGEKPIDI